MQKITNIRHLRDNLLLNYDKLERRNITPNEARGISDMAGKIMNTCKLELGYARHHNKKRKIQFLES